MGDLRSSVSLDCWQPTSALHESARNRAHSPRNTADAEAPQAAAAAAAAASHGPVRVHTSLGPSPLAVAHRHCQQGEAELASGVMGPSASSKSSGKHASSACCCSRAAIIWGFPVSATAACEARVVVISCPACITMQGAFLQGSGNRPATTDPGGHWYMKQELTTLSTLSGCPSPFTVAYIPAGAARDRLGDARLQERRCSNAEASTSVGAFELIELSVSNSCCWPTHSSEQHSLFPDLEAGSHKQTFSTLG